MQVERYERKMRMSGQSDRDGKVLGDELTPLFVSCMIFGAAIPQSLLAYGLVWHDPCSDMFM